VARVPAARLQSDEQKRPDAPDAVEDSHPRTQDAVFALSPSGDRGSPGPHD
jgi:hypothetical protein